MILLKLLKTVKVIKVANSDVTKAFDFSHVAEEKMKTEILNLSSKNQQEKVTF